ncbi:hypothetical protein DFJ73DRAFT_301933 [Zopfochytrium polystomum]|nr:hypothetical protein DFJ73DRAFT_301933 [Zopfochytrium polystomum]
MQLRAMIFASSYATVTFLKAVALDPRFSRGSEGSQALDRSSVYLSIDLQYQDRAFSTAPLKAIDRLFFRRDRRSSSSPFSMGEIVCRIPATNRRLRALKRFLRTCRIRAFSLECLHSSKFSAKTLKSLLVRSLCLTRLYCYWGDPNEEAETIAEAAAMSPHLKALRIAITELRLEAFVRSLMGRGNRGNRIQDLKLRIFVDKHLRDAKTSSPRMTATADAIAKLLSSNHLIALDVEHTVPFDDVSVEPIISALESNNSRTLHFLRLSCALDHSIPKLARAAKGSRLRLLGIKRTAPSPERLADLISIAANAKDSQLEVLEVDLTEVHAAARSQQPSHAIAITELATAVRNSSLSALGDPFDLQCVCLESPPFFRAVTTHASLRYRNFAHGFPGRRSLAPPLALRAARCRADILANVVLTAARILLIPATSTAKRTSQLPRRITRWTPPLSRVLLDSVMSACFHPRDAAAVLDTLSDRASIGFLDASTRSLYPCPCTLRALCDCSLASRHCHPSCDRFGMGANRWEPPGGCAVWERLFVWRCAAFVDRRRCETG